MLKPILSWPPTTNSLGLIGWVKTGDTSETAENMVDALSIKTPTIKQQVKNLSGGNQQKVVIGKWLTADTEISDI